MTSITGVRCTKSFYKEITMPIPRATRWLAQLLSFAGVIALSGCGEVSLKWSEEIQLEDGQVVVAERTAQGKKYSELGGPKSWNQTEMSVVITKAPNGIKPPPEWHAAYVPALLDYQPSSNSWSIVATFYFCETWYELGRPVPPYIEYQSTNGSPWKRVPLEERFIDRQTNLLTGPSSDGEPSLVTIVDKELRQRSAAPKYKNILRKWGREQDNFCDIN